MNVHQYASQVMKNHQMNSLVFLAQAKNCTLIRASICTDFSSFRVDE